MAKKLCKIEDGKMIFGVCNGVANYFEIDPTVVRLLWAFMGIFYGIGGLAYIIAAAVLPAGEKEPEETQEKQKKDFIQ